MASGHVSRIERPNTWLHRPMLQNVKKLLPTRSRPHMTLFGRAAPGPACPLMRDDRTQLKRAPTSVDDPTRTLALAQGQRPML